LKTGIRVHFAMLATAPDADARKHRWVVAKIYGDVVNGSPKARAVDIGPTVKALQAAGKTSLRAIAAGLNDQGIPTAHGQGTWSAVQVARVLDGKGYYGWMGNSRSEAKYQGERALFLLLITTARIDL
jgi:hypothetical protein